jgi:hypothetical protein
MTDSENIPVQPTQTPSDGVEDAPPVDDRDEREFYSAEDWAAIEAARAERDLQYPEWEAEQKDRDRLTAEAEPKLQMALDLACRMDEMAERLRGCVLDLAPGGAGLQVSQPHGLELAGAGKTPDDSWTLLSVDACYVLDHTPEYLALGLLHEAWHLKLDHCARQARCCAAAVDRDPWKVLQLLFNAASDLEVNAKLAHLFQAIGEDPPKCTPGRSIFAEIPVGLTAEEYMETILMKPTLRAAVVAEYGPSRL